MTLHLEIGPHLTAVAILGVVAWLVVEWWSYASGWRKGER
jgi:hypothetical protein